MQKERYGHPPHWFSLYYLGNRTRSSHSSALVRITAREKFGDDDTDLFQNVTWNTATNQNEDIFIRYSLTVANSTGLLQD